MISLRLLVTTLIVLVTSAANANPSKQSTAVMDQFIATVKAGPETVGAETVKLQRMYRHDAVHTDKIFELRGPRELAGFARYAGKTPSIELSPLAPNGRFNRTHYMYKLGGKFDVVHVVGTEHFLDSSGKVMLQHEQLDLIRWSQNIPGSRLVLSTRIGRNLLRLAANYGVQAGLEKQGSIKKRNTLQRALVAIERARSVSRTHDPSWLQRRKLKKNARTSKARAAKR